MCVVLCILTPHSIVQIHVHFKDCMLITSQNRQILRYLPANGPTISRTSCNSLLVCNVVDRQKLGTNEQFNEQSREQV
jgi:hypothetical protein